MRSEQQLSTIYQPVHCHA